MRQLLLQETHTISGGSTPISEMLYLKNSISVARNGGCSLTFTELSDVTTDYPLVEFSGKQYAITNVIDACKTAPDMCQVKYVLSCSDTGKNNNDITRMTLCSFE